ncbi:muscarinic acetylcholine receptor DM1 [Trichogramma pretiosum]|uniref:muscarinic acetylcholine receptor DM1 n=1 Tax=Trichogramma pretiosum TaxID=7493 RepID=UPI000C71C92D|nr:muscarinic acetylcholine receptor DM1 [Trichogramma pretiosum]XP_023313817.1 muscarinic acetylcholine receptor DM1 [Trichogramma pretiosum]
MSYDLERLAMSTSTDPYNYSLESSSASYNQSVEVPLGYQYPLWKVILITAVASCLSLVTVIGNIMVMVSFKIDKQLQTISNYFLFSLAVADFAIGLISMPLFTVYTVLGYWPLGSHICDTWLALDYLASNASVLNLLIISFDRYFSVTRPLTYRAKRTTAKAAFMIGCAWGISLLLWPPWIYAWPYIEGERTVPENACYIQFIETNHYITFGTAIAAFYVPVSVMAFLYWRIWQETEKRQKDLPNLQAGKQDASKRSNSSDEALDMEECRRPRSESSTGAGDELNSTHIAVSYLDRHYPQHRKHRPLSWTWLKLWCIDWWRSGRDEDDEDDDDDEACGAESSRTAPGYEEATLTPVSLETPVPSVTSRWDSFGVTQSTSLNLDIRDAVSQGGGGGAGSGEYMRPPPGSRTPGTLSAATISTQRSVSNDPQVYTILIKLPGPPSGRGGRFTGAVEAPSIKMYADDVLSIQSIRPGMELSSVPGATNQDVIVQHAEPHYPTHQHLQQHHHQQQQHHQGSLEEDTCSIASKQTLARRPSQMTQDSRIPLNAKNIGKTGAAQGKQAGGPGGGGKAAVVAPVKKKKKSQEKKADKKAAKTLSAILAAFILTWTPYNILVLLKPLTACTGCIPQELWEFFYYLCYINSTVNPVCYALCNATFRRTYVRILKCKWHSRNRTGVNRGY